KLNLDFPKAATVEAKFMSACLDCAIAQHHYVVSVRHVGAHQHRDARLIRISSQIDRHFDAIKAADVLALEETLADQFLQLDRRRHWSPLRPQLAGVPVRCGDDFRAIHLTGTAGAEKNKSGDDDCQHSGQYKNNMLRLHNCVSLIVNKMRLRYDKVNLQIQRQLAELRTIPVGRSALCPSSARTE